jgi:DNA-binding transcriptional MerR regulator
MERANVARGELTAGDIARRIARANDDQQALIERVRHWTREGLLTPLIYLSDLGLHPGTGRYRRYDEEQVYRAAVLNALAERGATVRQLGAVIRGLNHIEDDEKELWELAKAGKARGDQRVMLVMPMVDGPLALLIQGIEELAGLLAAADALMVVNLELLASVKSD